MRAQKWLHHQSSFIRAPGVWEAIIQPRRAGIPGLTRRWPGRRWVRATRSGGGQTRMTAMQVSWLARFVPERGPEKVRVAPMQRKPEHVASAATFLASDMAQDITGWTVGIQVIGYR